VVGWIVDGTAVSITIGRSGPCATHCRIEDDLMVRKTLVDGAVGSFIECYHLKVGPRKTEFSNVRSAIGNTLGDVCAVEEPDPNPIRSPIHDVNTSPCFIESCTVALRVWILETTSDSIAATI